MRPGLRSFAAGSVLVCLLAGAVPAGGQDVAQVEREYHEALEEEARVRADFDAAVARQFELAAQVEELDAAIAGVEAELADAQLRLDDATERAADARRRLRQTERELAAQEALLREQAVAAYIGGGSGPMPNFSAALKDEHGFDALAKSQVYASAVVTDRRAMVDRLAELRGRAAQLREDTTSFQTLARGARDDIAARNQELLDRRQEQQDAQAGAAEAAARAESLFAELEGRRRAYELRYAEIATQSDSIRDLLAVRQRDQLPADTTFGILLNPVRNGPVVSQYGMRMHPILGYERMHAGVDIDGPMGEPLRASADGVVVLAEERGGYGLAVVIDHGNQLATLYGHMSAIDVRPGDLVARGQAIGRLGSTGLSTGPHCHWEVRVLGVPVDGVPYLSTAPE